MALKPANEIRLFRKIEVSKMHQLALNKSLWSNFFGPHRIWLDARYSHSTN